MTDDDRAYLLTRCLKLEEENHALEVQLRRAGRTPRRFVTAAEDEAIRVLLGRGWGVPHIAARLGWSHETIRKHVQRQRKEET